MPPSVVVLMTAVLTTQAEELPSPIELDAIALDVASLTAYAERLDDACRHTREAQTCYTRAWAAYRLASATFTKGQPKDAGPALVACATTLSTITSDPTWGAEAKALLTGCYGMSIALNPMKGMSLGPKTARLTAEALAAAPNSPRAHLFAAQRLSNTPKAWGGDPAKAREHAARGLELIKQAEPTGAWGRSDLERIMGEREDRSDE